MVMNTKANLNNMKAYLLLICTCFSIVVFSQDRNNTIIESKNDSIINSELKIFERSFSDLIVFQDDQKNILIISEKKYVRIFQGKNKKVKRKVGKMNRKQYHLFRKCIKNRSLLKLIKEEECNNGFNGRSNKCATIRSDYYKNGILEFSNSFYGSLIYVENYYKENYLLDLYNYFLYKSPTIQVSVED